MSTPAFDTAFSRYLIQAKEAHNQNLHHDHRRQLFVAFLADAFAIQPTDIETEKYIQIANQQTPLQNIARIRKGWIEVCHLRTG